MDDKELMAQVCAGNHQAFELLVDRYWRVAEYTARGILNNAALAQDVAQDVFADIFMQRAKYEPRFSFTAYVKAVTRYKSIDLLRKRGKAQCPEDAIKETRTPEEAVIQKMFQSALYAAIERLPKQQQRMIKAYALDQHSYREIAAEMRLSVAQVKITLFRIRKRLRCLRDDWEG